MTIKMPMDPDLYDAACNVLDEIEAILVARQQWATKEDVLGKRLADAYDRWQMLLISKYASTPDLPTAPPARSQRGRGGYRGPQAPPAKNHPWRGLAVPPKRK